MTVHERQRPVDDPDDVGQGDGVGRPGQPVTTVRSAPARDDTGSSQVDTNEIGLAILGPLRELDEVAH